MDIHFLKSRAPFFEGLFFRTRNFEVRNNDRNFCPGDLAVFYEVFPPDWLIPNIYDPRSVPRCVAAEILSVVADLPGLDSSFCVLQLDFVGDPPAVPAVPDSVPPVFVNNAYYDQGGFPVIDVLFAKLTAPQFEGFLLGNAIKYSLRLNWKVVCSGAASARTDDARKLLQYFSWFYRLIGEGRESFKSSLDGSLPPFKAAVTGLWGCDES